VCTESFLGHSVVYWELQMLTNKGGEEHTMVDKETLDGRRTTTSGRWRFGSSGRAPSRSLPTTPSPVMRPLGSTRLLAAHLLQANKPLRAQGPSVCLSPTCVLVAQSGVEACISIEWRGKEGS
jgi:hypothetical protein